MAAAVAHLFRAACGLADPRAAALRGILSALAQELQLEGLGFGRGTPEAQLLLRYQQLAMALFEREGAPEGAVMFARAAVEQAAAVYGADRGAERLQLEGGPLRGAAVRCWRRAAPLPCAAAPCALLLPCAAAP